MLDFKLTSELDLEINGNGEYATQTNNETTLVTAFFTDARVNNQRGYWVDLIASELWQYEQSRVNSETSINIQESAREVAKQLVEREIFDRVETGTSIVNNKIVLNIKCYNKSNIILEKEFII